MAQNKSKTTDSKQTKDKTDKASSLIADNTVVELIIPWEKAEPAYQKALKKLSADLKAPGFRKGKVPAQMAEEMLTPGRIVEAALNKIVGEYYQKAIEKSGKKPLSNPDIKPTSIEMGQDWKLEAAFAEEPTVKLGSYKSAIKKAVKEAETEHKKHEAETKKDAKKQAAEAVDDHQHTLEDHQIHSIYRALVTTIKPSIPEILLRDQTRSELERLVKSLEPSKVNLETYLQRRGQTFEQLSQEMATVALGQLQLEFILREIAKTEKIEVTDKDIEAEYKKLVGSDKQAPAKPAPEVVNYLKSILQRKKINEFLLKLK